jgi:hypothetical protein
LLLVWQEHHLQGHDLAPADLCRDCPELAPELEQRIQVLRHLSQLMQPDSAPGGPGAAELK